jgi:hypothetical protein
MRVNLPCHLGQFGSLDVATVKLGHDTNIGLVALDHKRPLPRQVKN